MANSKRREKFTDRNGNMLIPINVEGGNYNEHFLTTPKLLTIAALLVGLGYVIYKVSHIHLTLFNFLFWVGGYLIIFIYSMRYIVFEEKFYYKMYQQLKEHEISTPALFWDIASIKDTDEGAIITYSDARIAIVVKVERDTITGKDQNFKETHYDAISDFYKDVIIQKYNFVQMNIMEQAGKDPRLTELSKVVYKSDNPNIQKLMELEVGYIKNITHTSLYESDYFLFYTSDLSKLDSIIGDITESMFKLLDGAYVSYRVLTSKEIVELVKDDYGVTYFNSTEASLLMYSTNSNYNMSPFDITGLLWTDGEEQKLNDKEKNKLRQITSGVINETIKTYEMALKKTLYRKEEKNKVGIDFSSLSETTSEQRKSSLGTIRKPNIQKKDTDENKDNTPVNDEEIKKVNIKKSSDDDGGSGNSGTDEEYIDF